MSNSVDSDQPCFTKVHNWLARLHFRDRARPEPKWPLVTRLLGEPLVRLHRPRPASGRVMTAVTLTRTDHARRMARFYVLDVQPDLFGAWCFIREWGRIGRPGQLRHVPYPTEDEAREALARQRRAKERRGYRSA
jgi:predicted DNA-binding WGR domain protein